VFPMLLRTDKVGKLDFMFEKGDITERYAQDMQ
jgi:hypothetical protein